MERRRLGRSGLDVPVIGMGTWRTFDTHDDRRPLVEEALAAGIDLFDSSPMYGRAETVLARALEGRRAEVRVATKLWAQDIREGQRQAEHALRLYDWVDVYQVHNLADWQAELELLAGLAREGRVKAVGVTHYQEARFDDLARVMRSQPLDMVQIPYNPLRRQAEQVLLPLAAELGLGVLVMSPLQGGILDHEPSPDELASLGVKTWPQAILKWIASDERVSCVLTATSRRGRPTENAQAGEPPWFTPEQRDLVVRIASRVPAR